MDGCSSVACAGRDLPASRKLVPVHDTHYKLLNDIHLVRMACGCKQRERGQRFVGDNRFADFFVQRIIFFQEEQKAGCCNPFVAIHKRVVLYNKIQECCCFFFD